MYYTFIGAAVFDQPLVWDTSSLETLEATFYAAVNFNSELDWDTSKVTMGISSANPLPRVCHDVTFASPASCSDWSSRRSGR